jgi:hypothetical protein
MVGSPIDRADMRWRIVARTTDLLLPGLYAWAVTVAWPVLVRPSGSLARSLAVASLSALLAGSLLSIRWPTIARVLGVWSFLALCTGVWASARFPAGAPLLDPVQGVAGSLGWALFALGWASDGTTALGRSARPGPHVGSPAPLAEPPTQMGAPYAPRSRKWRGAAWFLGLAVAAAAILMVLAWRVSGRARESFAHAAAICGAVALVGAASEIAVSPQGAGRPSEAHLAAGRGDRAWRARLGGATGPLILLAVMALLGVTYAWMR